MNIRYAMIDIEGYQVTKETKDIVNKMIENKKKKNNIKFKTFVNNTMDFFQIGVEIFEIDYTSTPKINRLDSENFVRFDPILYDKDIAKNLFIFGRRSILATMDKSILCKTHSEMKSKLESFLNKNKVTTIVGYGDLEKSYLTQVNIGTLEKPESYLQLQEHSGNGYYYLDMKQIVELVLKDDLRNNRNIIKIMEDKTYYTKTYNQYSTTAENIYKTLLEHFKLTDKDEVNRNISMQLHIGNKDAKIQTFILESLLKYDYESPSKILHRIFMKNSPQKIVNELIEVKEEYKDTTLGIKLEKLPFGSMPKTIINKKEDYYKVYRFILENFNYVTYGNNKTKGSFNNDIFFRQTITFYNNNEKEYSMSKNLLKKIFNELKGTSENGDWISITYDRHKQIIYISINDEMLLASVDVLLFPMTITNAMIGLFDTGEIDNKFIKVFDNVFIPTKESISELYNKIIENKKKGIIPTELTTERQTEQSITTEIKKKKIKNTTSKEFQSALNYIIAYNEIQASKNLKTTKNIKTSRTQPKGKDAIILQEINFIQAFKLFLENYNSTKITPKVIDDIINGKVFLVDIKTEKVNPLSVPQSFTDLLLSRKVAKINNTLTTKKSKKIYFYV